jgi:hypothetical protein
MALASQVEASLRALGQREDELVAHLPHPIQERLRSVALPFDMQPPVALVDRKANPENGGARNYLHRGRAQYSTSQASPPAPSALSDCELGRPERSFSPFSSYFAD